MRPVPIPLTAAILSLPASAALPPAAQRFAEFRAVINHPEIGAAMGNDPITRIEFVREDLYRVSGARCRADLVLVCVPPPPGLVGGCRSGCGLRTGAVPETARATPPPRRRHSAAFGRRMRPVSLEG